MKKLLFILALILCPAASRAACTMASGGVGLCYPNFGDSGSVWAASVRNNFVILNSSVPVATSSPTYTNLTLSGWVHAASSVTALGGLYAPMLYLSKGLVSISSESSGGYGDSFGVLKLSRTSGGVEQSDAYISGYRDETNTSAGLKFATKYDATPSRPVMYLPGYGGVLVSTFATGPYDVYSGVGVQVVNQKIFAKDGDVLVSGGNNVGQFAIVQATSPTTILNRIYRDSADILHMQSPQQIYSILDLTAMPGEPLTDNREATISLSRNNSAGDNGEGMDIFNFVDGAAGPRMGININRVGNGQWREFGIGHHVTGTPDVNLLTVKVSSEVVTHYRLGVGTNTPAYMLDVAGGGHFTSSMTVDGGIYGSVTGAASLNVLKAGDTMSGPLNVDASVTVDSLTVTGLVNGNYLAANRLNIGNGFGVATNPLFVLNNVAPATYVVKVSSSNGGNMFNIYGNGDIGANTEGGNFAIGALTGDGSKLYVAGNATVTGSVFSVGGSTLVVAGGKVGVGTTAPDQKLTVAGNISTTGTVISSGTGSNYFAGVLGTPGIVIPLPTADTRGMVTDVGVNGSAIYLVKNASGDYSIRFDVTDTGIANYPNAMVINYNGKVGISVTAPKATLDVAGGIGSYSRTMAQLLAITPLQVGVQYFCNNCTPAKMVVSTGTAAGNFADIMGGAFQ